MTDATKPEERDMKLRYSPTSPFVRKALIAAYEVGLEDKIEKISTDPWAADTDLRADNPLSKVPCLVTDEGETIFDSLVICEYLNTMGNGSLFPTDIQARTAHWMPVCCVSSKPFAVPRSCAGSGG
jgi:glutathione S-transferase